MQAFEFHNPTKIIFGNGSLERVGETVAGLGQRVLLVYGRDSIKKNGVYDRLMESLKSTAIAEIIEHGGVHPNPLLSHLRAGIEIAKEQQVDVILAVGGGSVMDEAKGIAAGCFLDGDIWKLYTGVRVPDKALPLVMVPTLPATGSEMNGGSVITHDETREKFGTIHPLLQPKVSLLDPELTHTLPADYSAFGAVDAISHLLEGYFTCEDPWTPIQDRYVEGLVKTIMEATDRIMKNPEDNDARATMMWAATLAWNGLAPSGIGSFALPNHMIEHPLSGRHNIAHGAGLAIVIPAWMAMTLEENPIKFALFAERVFGIDAIDEKARARQGTDALRAWFKRIGCPTTLAEGGIPADDLEGIAEAALQLGKMWGMEMFTKDQIIEVLYSCDHP